MAGDKTMSGTLYGLGVGPGDPELLTVKAWRLVATADTIAYLCANGGESTALEIVRPFLPETFAPIAIDMPMRVEREPAQAAYDQGCARIAAALEQGKDVVFLCEGDPFFYGSFIYVFERLAQTRKIVVVPGITSITAAAAQLGQPLVQRDEVLKVLPATLPEAALRAELQTANVAAIIKVGRHFAKVKAVLEAAGLLECATAIEHATKPQQKISALTKLESDTLPYFTTLIVRRK
jgi:precorrin-2/cobalt-factor-2 C20-methyltransferase